MNKIEELERKIELLTSYVEGYYKSIEDLKNKIAEEQKQLEELKKGGKSK